VIFHTTEDVPREDEAAADPQLDPIPDPDRRVNSHEETNQRRKKVSKNYK